MILRTDSLITTLLCYLHPMLVSFNYHDTNHVRVDVDIDNALTALCLACLAALAFILILE